MNDLVEAIRAGDVDEVRALLARSPELASQHHAGSFGATGLIHAVQSGDRAMVDALLEAGAHIDQRSDWWAGSFGVLDQASDDLAAYLLERGSTLTPHAAARLGMIEELRAMVARDSSCVHSRGGDGQFPLHFARTPEIADLLLDAGAEIDARDIDHESTAAQWLAKSRRPVASRLLVRGCEADPFLAALTGAVDALEGLVVGDPEGVNALVTRARFSTKGERAAEHIYFYTIGQGCSLLHAAAEADQADVIRWLCDRGADPEVRGGHDQSAPLHSAAWNNAADATEALLDGGADMEAVSGKIHENEPIGWAIVSGAADAFQVLLDRGASVRDPHRVDAAAGARGEFRELNRERPIEKWIQIRDALQRA